MTGATVTMGTGEVIASFRTPRGQLAPMTIRAGTNDWNTLNACMSEDEYGLRDWQGEGWAVDVGGYLGGVAIGLALDNPGLSVLVIEPVPDNARLIRENIAHNSLQGRVVLVEGVGGDGAEVTVMFNYRGSETAVHHRFVGNSTLAYEDSTEGHDSLLYPFSHTVGSILADLDTNRLALLKIDCEGGEWAFLDTPDVSRIDEIRGEWHPTKGHVQADMLDLLGQTHDLSFDGPISGPGGFRAVAR